MISLSGAFAPVISILKVGVVFIVLIIVSYIFILPTWFPHHRTYSILILGCIAAGMVSGWIGYQEYVRSSHLVRIASAFLYMALELFFVAIVSFIIILNTRGS